MVAMGMVQVAGVEVVDVVLVTYRGVAATWPMLMGMDFMGFTGHAPKIRPRANLIKRGGTGVTPTHRTVN